MMTTGRNTGWPALLFFWLSVILPTLPCPGTSFAASDGRTVTVGVYENAPKVFISESGQPAGIFIDIIEHIAGIEGWKLRYVSGTWGEGLDRLEAGQIDLMPDVAFTADRARIYGFHKVPVLSSWFQVCAPEGSGIRSILDLKGKRILVLDRSIQHEAFEKLSQSFGLDSTLVAVADYKTMFEMVDAGRADAAITNRFYGMMHARQFGLENTAVIFEPPDLFFATPGIASKKTLLGVIDRHLSSLKQDHRSIYYQSLKRWTAEEVRFRMPGWLKILGISVGFVLVASLAGSLILKHQVNARTRELKQINQEMEQRIAERTAELVAINTEQRAIFDSASSGIVLLRNRVIVRCNSGLEEISGYLRSELIGESTRIWYPDEKTYEAEGQTVYERLMRGETYHWEQRMTRKDGASRWIRLSLRALEKNDPLNGAVGIIEDVTDEREAAEKLRQAMEKAQEADRIKSAFLATMSHELRTPLNSIIGFTGIMLQGLAGPLNEEQNKQMTMVQKSARHLLALINDVLDISKIEAGQLVLSCSSFDLRQSIEKTVQLISPLAEKKGIEIRMEIAENVKLITADQRRLEQVILNLLSNAVKFTDNGHVRIACRMEEGHFALSVSDTGIGMKPEALPHIFQPFHQIDAGLSRKREGTGLGLSICKKILDMMGGSIAVESQLGHGSTFTARFSGKDKVGHEPCTADH
jgi:PAS domain S-box-containing protein